MNSIKRIGLGLLSLVIATAIWLPAVHFLFTPARKEYVTDHQAIPEKARLLAARHLRLWTDPALKRHEIQRMRGSNAEWDFMGRSFLVWALAEMAVRDPSLKKEYLPVMDEIIEETIRLEQEHGIYFFLMSYAKDRNYIIQPARSLFVDSEIALMLAVRRFVEEKESYQPLLQERVDNMVKQMRRSKAFAAESYPDECWIFDHGVGLAAIKLADYLDHTDHSEFFREWMDNARAKLSDPKTRLLVSSYTIDGEHLDGPEGSSIWMAAYCLQLIDKEFAREQYDRARKEMGRVICGFGYSREWPVSWQGPRDIDSGVVIPILEISPGGSGLAFIGASGFKDEKFLSHLHTTLDFAGFPMKTGGRMKYCASNQVGDAVMLYSLVLGPIWEKVGNFQSQPKKMASGSSSEIAAF